MGLTELSLVKSAERKTGTKGGEAEELGNSKERLRGKDSTVARVIA